MLSPQYIYITNISYYLKWNFPSINPRIDTLNSCDGNINFRNLILKALNELCNGDQIIMHEIF